MKKSELIEAINVLITKIDSYYVRRCYGGNSGKSKAELEERLATLQNYADKIDEKRNLKLYWKEHSDEKNALENEYKEMEEKFQIEENEHLKTIADFIKENMIPSKMDIIALDTYSIECGIRGEDDCSFTFKYVKPDYIVEKYNLIITTKMTAEYNVESCFESSSDFVQSKMILLSTIQNVIEDKMNLKKLVEMLEDGVKLHKSNSDKLDNFKYSKMTWI